MHDATDYVLLRASTTGDNGGFLPRITDEEHNRGGDGREEMVWNTICGVLRRDSAIPAIG